MREDCANIGKVDRRLGVEDDICQIRGRLFRSTFG